MSCEFPAYTSLLNVFGPETVEHIGVNDSTEAVLLEVLSGSDTSQPSASKYKVDDGGIECDSESRIESAPDEHLVLSLAIEGHAIDTTAKALGTDCASVEAMATELWTETVAHVDELQRQLEAVTQNDDVNETDVFINELLQHLS